jgi:hypothetical protein
MAMGRQSLPIIFFPCEERLLTRPNLLIEDLQGLPVLFQGVG